MAVLDALRQAGSPQTVKELCATLGVPENVLRVRLCRMHHREEVQALGEGRYALPTWTATPTPGGITYVVPRDASAVIPVMAPEEPAAPVVEPPAAVEAVAPLDAVVAADGHEQGEPVVAPAAAGVRTSGGI